MGRRAFLTVSCFVVFVGCGYVGPVQPPSPEIPATITDLAAVERGDKIIVTFSTPPRTTDGVGISKFSEIDLRVGPEQQPPGDAKSYSMETPPAGDREDPQPRSMAYSIDVREWTGQRVAVFVRTAVKKTGHFSKWSNKVVLNIISPLTKPVVYAAGSGAGIVLNWTGPNADGYCIQRQGPADKQPLELATAAAGSYLDTSAQYDTEYRYIVTARQDGAESLPSEPIAIRVPDIYPPATPAGLTALVAPDAIDLAWQRNSEPDFQGYYIYRSVNNGTYQRVGNLVALPTYTDHAVEHGKSYSYQVSAVDKKNNESDKSSPAEVQF